MSIRIVSRSAVLLFFAANANIAIGQVGQADILATANKIMDEVRQGAFPLHIGRKSLLNEMIKHPNQILLDIPRFTSIGIGGSSVPAGPGPGEQQYATLANKLEQYVKAIPAFKNKVVAGRIAKFWTAEIIYALAQTFSAPAQVEAYKNEPDLSSGQWGASPESSKLLASIKFIPPQVLEVSVKSEKTLRNVSNEKAKPKKFTTEGSLLFDLNEGEVNYRYRYDLDGKNKSWGAQTFFP